MKVLYVGSFLEPSQEEFVKLNKTAIAVSTTTFQRAFLSGFECTDFIDYIINVPDVGSYPKRCKSFLFPSSCFDYFSIKGVNESFFNITYFKRYSIYYSLKKSVENWLKIYLNETVVLVVYSLITPYIRAAIEVKRKYANVRVCCIVADLPEYFNDNQSVLSELVLNRNVRQIYSLIPDIDSFVLLTADMKYPLNIGNKPWMLLEGIYQPRESLQVEKRRKSLLYAGKLDARFGIRDLIEAFCDIKDPEFELWICGDGQERNYVLQAAKNDKRIKYYGQIEQMIVFKMQQEASLLINPRKPEGEYTKYSFPSKTMEYMASGTPTIMYKLQGVPDEYYKYLVLIEDETKESLVSAILDWGNRDQKELSDFGSAAHDFIMNHKTSFCQVRKFINFMLKNYS